MYGEGMGTCMHKAASETSHTSSWAALTLLLKSQLSCSIVLMLMGHALDIVGDQRADQHALQPVLCVSCHHPCHRLHLQLRLSRIVAGLTELQSDLRLSLMDCYCEWVGIKLHLQFTPSQYLSTTMSDRGHNAHLWS